MKTKTKALIKKGNRYVVEPVSLEDLACRLVEEKAEVEWLFSHESSLVKPFAFKKWFSLVTGAVDCEAGLIHVFLDNILRVYGLIGDVDVVDWLVREFTHCLVHELIHFLNPHWIERQVGNAACELIKLSFEGEQK